VLRANRLCGELGLDESKSLITILVNVLLVSIGVVAVAAVSNYFISYFLNKY
jgi:hypothetical protein